MLRLKQLVLFLIAVPGVCAGHITAHQARTMPLKELAKKLLGETGAIMIAVDRPRVAGILESVRFYSHATVPGSQFGMCAADRVTVGFDEKGNVESISAQTRYGVAGDIYRDFHGNPGQWSYDEFGKICDSVSSTREYFPAPDPESAQDVILYVDAISAKGPFARQSFDYKCIGWCANDRGALKWLRLDMIDAVKKVDCPTSSFKLPSCYEITVGQDRIGPFPKIYTVVGTTYMNKVAISQVAVHVMSTIP